MNDPNVHALTRILFWYCYITQQAMTKMKKDVSLFIAKVVHGKKTQPKEDPLLEVLSDQMKKHYCSVFQEHQSSPTTIQLILCVIHAYL